MDDKSKTKAQLNSELAQLREKVALLESTESKYRNVFENSPIGIFQSTPAGQYRLVNPAFAHMTGFASPEEMLNKVKNISTLYANPADREEVKRMFAQQGQLNGHVIRHKRRDGQMRWMSIYAKAVYNDSGEIIYYDGITLDITKQKQAQQELQETNRFIQNVNDLIPNQVYVFDLIKGQNVYINLQVENFYGLPLSDLQAKGQSFFLDILHPDDLPKINEFNDQWKEAEDNQVFEKEYRLKNAAGDYHWIRSYERVFNRDSDGNPTQILGTAVDITDRKQTEEALQLSKAALEKAQQVANMGSWTWYIQSNQLEWSDQMYHIFGINKETFTGDLGDVNSRAIHPDDRAQVELTNMTIINGNRPKQPLEYRVIWPDGSVRVVWAEAGELIFDEAGNPVVLTGIAQDITERKKTEKALQASEEKFRSLFKAINVPTYTWQYVGDDFVLRDYNETALTITGGTISDIVGIKASVMYEEDEQALQDFRQCLQQKSTITREMDYRFKTTGERKYLKVNYTYVPPNLVMVHTEDLTERKQAEQSLKESENQFKRAVIHSPVPIMIHDDDDNILQLSKGWTDYSGYTIEDIPTMLEWTEKAYGSSTGSEKEYIDKLFEINETIDNGEWTVTAKDGSKRIWAFKTTPLGKNAKGQRLLHSTAVDITERKQAEKALLENQERYEKAQAMGHVGNWEYDPVTAKFWGSDEAKRIYGFDLDAKDFSADTVEICIPERERVHQALIDLIEHDKKYDLEFDIITKDKGLRKTIHSIAEVERDAQGNPVKVTGVIIDITERKQAAETIIKSQERFDLAMKASKDGLFDWDLETNEIYYSPGWKSMLGYDYDEIPNDFSIWETNTHPKDVERSWQMQEDLINKKRDRFEIEFKMKHKDGHWVDILSRAEALFDENGKAVRIVGTHVDISDSKKAQRKLQESEGKYRSLVETASDAIYLMDEDGIIIDTNQSACDTTGKAREEIIGHSIDSVDPNFPVNKFLEFWQNVPFNKQMIFESTHLHKNGILIPVELSGKKVKLDNKIYFYGIARDITERNQAKSKQTQMTLRLEQQARQLRMVMDSVPEGVFVINSKGRIISANPTAHSDLSFLAGDIGVSDKIEQLGGHPLNDLLLRPPEGLWHQISWQNRSFELIAKPLKGSKAAAGWVIVIRDVTIEKSIQEQIQQQERLVSVGQLAAGIAHDFNNIMAVISLYADLSLKDPRLPPDMTRRFDTIKKQSGRAGELIQQILDFSRRSVMERLPMDLIPFLKELKKLFDRTLPENIDVRLSYTENSFIVHGDPTRLQQVIMNLVVNARDAMPDGGMIQIDLTRKNPSKFGTGLLDLTRKLKQDGKPREWVCLTIQDNGVGIPANVLPHIFDPFYTTKDSGKGTGLGLAQVSGIIGQHDGKIDVLTELGEGSAFIVYLPLLEETDSINKIIEVEDIPFGHGETILVVEDNPEMRQAIVNSLEGLNYRVQAARNGREALAILREHGNEIALILTDLIMPEMGGKALLQALKQAGTTIKVIVMTGHPLTDEKETIMALGAVDWVNKPPSLEKLGLTIARALE